MDIVQQYGLEKKYGISARNIQKIINKLVDKGKLDRKYQTEQKKITRVKQDPDIKGSKGTEPAKYYAKDAGGKGMSKSTKQDRDTHFKNQK